METLTPASMSRPHQRRTSEQKIADLERKIAELQARKEARAKKSDPVLKEALKLNRHLKVFIQAALDHRRPDVANSALGFKSSLERVLSESRGALSLDNEEQLDGEDE